nr:sigma-70 family RNA polymerase sigma factor [Curtobacterium flaccumfaciens]
MRIRRPYPLVITIVKTGSTPTCSPSAYRDGTPTAGPGSTHRDQHTPTTRRVRGARRALRPARSTHPALPRAPDGPADGGGRPRQTFVVALTRWDARDPDWGEPLLWLFGIATNLLRRHWRSESRGRRAMARAALPEALESDPGDRVDQERAVRAVIRELDRMRPAVRDTVLLHAWAELTYEQIAEATGVPIGTVRSRLNRARTVLRTVPDTTDPLNGAARA